MKKRKKAITRREDVNETAFRVMRIATGSDVPNKNPNAVALGRLGGLKGGPARTAKLDPERRQQIASKAARARWDKKRKS